jgi:hypothetical protein
VKSKREIKEILIEMPEDIYPYRYSVKGRIRAISEERPLIRIKNESSKMFKDYISGVPGHFYRRNYSVGHCDRISMDSK